MLNPNEVLGSCSLGTQCWDTHSPPVEDSNMQAQTANFVTHNDLVSENAEYDLKDWCNQMDVLIE